MYCYEGNHRDQDHGGAKGLKKCSMCSMSAKRERKRAG